MAWTEALVGMWSLEASIPTGAGTGKGPLRLWLWGLGAGAPCHTYHLDKVGLDYSWYYAVHSDAFWSQLHSQRLTEAQQGSLADVVDSQLL